MQRHHFNVGKCYPVAPPYSQCLHYCLFDSESTGKLFDLCCAASRVRQLSLRKVTVEEGACWLLQQARKIVKFNNINPVPNEDAL